MDVLVVGAGPAGGQLASQLARSGQRVQLIDQLQDLRQAAFSSAGLPLQAMVDGGLPAELAGHRWDSWQIIGPGEQRWQWGADQPLGVVLDFGALRCWLAEQTRLWGGTVSLGVRALSCREDGDGMVTRVRLRSGATQDLRSRWVVDASGQARSLLGDPGPRGGRAGREDRLWRAVGVEWLLAVPEPLWRRWAGRLSFCLGSDWVPQGYGWVFPMQAGVLKLGVCHFAPGGGAELPLVALLERLLARLLLDGDGGAPGSAAGSSCSTARLAAHGIRVLDRHGGLVRSSISRREPHRRGRLIGLGDAVSTANLLGGEGIRHAFTASRCLAPLLVESLERERAGRPPAAVAAPLDRYPRHLRQALGWRWAVSGRIALRTWSSLAGPRGDRRLSRLLQGLQQRACARDLSALLFDYRFERYGLRLLPYLVGWR